MIIKEIVIKNFRSYYGEIRFEFSDGLTLILGDNGDGKTTFFEALQWLLNTGQERSHAENISEKRKSELVAGDEDEVSVLMQFEHNGDKSVEKRFTFERRLDGTIHLGAVSYVGYECNGVERTKINGADLIKRCYDTFIQQFTMFKGESTLNVFEGPTALNTLVNRFSDIRKFDNLVKYTADFEEKSNLAYSKEMRSDGKVKQEAKGLETSMTRLSQQIVDTQKEIQTKKASFEQYNSQIEQLESSQENAEKYKVIKDRLKRKEEELASYRQQVRRIDLNHSLLDRYWILCAFIPVLHEFQKKCSDLSQEKRKQERDYDRQKAKEIGKLEAVNELKGMLSNGATRLPWYLPNQETMEEMLKDHICKVCGREAPEGSDAYNFMLHKLEEYRQHTEMALKIEQSKKEITEKELFSQQHIEEMHNFCMSIAGGSNEQQIARYASDINERFTFVDDMRKKIKVTEQEIQDLKDEINRLLIHAGNISEEQLNCTFDDIKGLFYHRDQATQRIKELENQLKGYKADLNDLTERLNELDPASSLALVYRKIHQTLEVVAKAFEWAQKENLSNFLKQLEHKANQYLNILSSEDFHGEIRLIAKSTDSTMIKLFSSNGTEILKPSGSQRTVQYISILFAISDYTRDIRSEDYPLIFDAATSSFGDYKEEGFYNVVDKINKQCIIITKDFIDKGEIRMDDINKLTCSVYRIRKDDQYDQNDMSTIRTIIKKIK